MKKFLTLALVLVLALSLAAPALAFWGNAPSTATAGGITLDIYLVDHDDSGSLLSGLISKPATDRGYAKNEIVAAVASVLVPKNVEPGTTNPNGKGYAELRLSGENVNVNVVDNKDALNAVALVNTFPATIGAMAFNGTNSAINVDVSGLLAPASAATYRILFFAKVTGDDATMNVTLSKNLAFSAATPSTLALGNTDYIVTKMNAQTYIISDGTDQLFRIRTTSSGKADSIEVTAQSTAVGAAANWFGVVYSGGYLYTMTEDQGGASINLGRLPTTAEQLVLDSRMNTIFATALGLDITKRGYMMDDAAWVDYANSLSDLFESVDVKPWTPYVTVPDNIVVDPPKTGDAASILGFVMIALAGAAVVAVKKVRA